MTPKGQGRDPLCLVLVPIISKTVGDRLGCNGAPIRNAIRDFKRHVLDDVTCIGLLI